MTIIFGGTFDPPHAGHVACARAAMLAFPEEKIWIMPALVPGAVAEATKAPHIPYSLRLELCRKSFGQLGKHCEVSDLESQLSAPNYTWNTIEYLRVHSKHQDFKLLVGEDQFSSIPQWHEAKRLWQSVGIVIVPRNLKDENSGQDFPTLLKSIANRMSWNYTLLSSNEAEWGPAHQRIRWLDTPRTPVSSSAIRNSLRSKQSVPKEWFEPSILEDLPRILPFFQKGTQDEHP